MKESTSSIQVEASTSCQGEPRVDLKASTSGTRQDNENEDVQQDEPRRPPSPPPRENNHANNNEERQEEEEQDNEEDVPPRPNKSYHEFEQELLKIIPSSKSTMTFKPGESLALKLV